LKCAQIKGLERVYRRGSFGYLKKIFLSQTTGPNALIFDRSNIGTRGFKFAQIKFLGS